MKNNHFFVGGWHIFRKGKNDLLREGIRPPSKLCLWWNLLRKVNSTKTIFFVVNVWEASKRTSQSHMNSLEPCHAAKTVGFTKMVNGFALYQMKKKNLSEGFAAQKMKFSIKDFFSRAAWNYGFGRIYWRYLYWKASFFVQWNLRLNFPLQIFAKRFLLDVWLGSKCSSVHDRITLFIVSTFNVSIDFSTWNVFVKFVIWRKCYFMFVLVGVLNVPNRHLLVQSRPRCT